MTSEVGSSFHGNQSNRNFLPSSHNDTRDIVSAHNVTLSIHGGHGQKCAIEYNEKLDIFEEVPVDEDG